MILRTRSSDEVVSALASCKGIIAIDGAMGAGKSWLACEIAGRLGGALLEMDEFLPERRPEPDEDPRYLARLELERVSVPEARPLVIDAICVRVVMARLGLVPECYVYVRAINANGTLNEEATCSMTRIREADKNGWDQNLDYLRAEIRDYHRQYDPEAHADIIFERQKAWLTIPTKTRAE